MSDKEEKVKVTIAVRVSKEDRLVMSLEASDRGLPTATWARMVLLKAAHQQKQWFMKRAYGVDAAPPDRIPTRIQDLPENRKGREEDFRQQQAEREAAGKT